MKNKTWWGWRLHRQLDPAHPSDTIRNGDEMKSKYYTGVDVWFTDVQSVNQTSHPTDLYCFTLHLKQSTSLTVANLSSMKKPECLPSCKERTSSRHSQQTVGTNSLSSIESRLLWDFHWEAKPTDGTCRETQKHTAANVCIICNSLGCVSLLWKAAVPKSETSILSDTPRLWVHSEGRHHYGDQILTNCRFTTHKDFAAYFDQWWDVIVLMYIFHVSVLYLSRFNRGYFQLFLHYILQ